MEKRWPPFYFDSNLFSDHVGSQQHFNKLCAAYGNDVEKVLNAKEATYGGARDAEERARHPKYGFRFECDGEPLRAFFERHGMHVEGM